MLFIFVCWCKFFNWIWYFNNVDKVEFDILTMFNKDALSSPVLFVYIKDCYLSYILVCVCSSILPRVCAPWHIYYIDSLHIEWNISGLYFLKFWWLWLTDNEIIIGILHKINKKGYFKQKCQASEKYVHFNALNTWLGLLLPGLVFYRFVLPCQILLPPIKTVVVQFDNEKCYLSNYVLLKFTPTPTLNLPLQ